MPLQSLFLVRLCINMKKYDGEKEAELFRQPAGVGDGQQAQLASTAHSYTNIHSIPLSHSAVGRSHREKKVTFFNS